MNNETCECCSENNRIWFEESDYCESSSMLKLYCYCAIVGWSWEDVKYKDYKWCKYCDEV
ncbi:41554_t:CDS:1, partial [Gigaspora margarita]